jgi:hypothetical protein
MKLFVASALLFLTACATITRGPRETISVDSRPSGAAASIKCDGGVSATGTPPARLVIPRRADNCVVEVSDGTRTRQRTLARGVGGMYWANFGLIGAFPLGVGLTLATSQDAPIATGITLGIAGGLGFLVDRLTGAMYNRDVHEVVIDLEP